MYNNDKDSVKKGYNNRKLAHIEQKKKKKPTQAGKKFSRSTLVHIFIFSCLITMHSCAWLRKDKVDLICHQDKMPAF